MFVIDLYTYTGQYDRIEADKLILSTVDGQRTLLSNHMPVMLILQPGNIRAVKSGKETLYHLSDGVVHFENNHAVIMANEISSEGRTSSNKGGSEENDIIMVKAELAKALRRNED